MGLLVKKNSWELDPVEIELFYRAVGTDDHCGGVDKISQALLDGFLDLWVWGSGSEKMVVISEIIVQLDGDREFLARMLAGENVIERFNEAQDDFEEIARDMGCSRMIACLKPEIMEAFKRSGVDLNELYSVVYREL